MLTHWLEQQTEKLRARQRAEGVAEGAARTDAYWRKWYREQLGKGFALDEPPAPPPENLGDGA